MKLKKRLRRRSFSLEGEEKIAWVEFYQSDAIIGRIPMWVNCINLVRFRVKR